MQKNPCVGCKFAKWNRTKSGALHPDGDGRCTWMLEIQAVAKSVPASRMPPITVCGGYISRRSKTSYELAPCSVRESAK